MAFCCINANFVTFSHGTENDGLNVTAHNQHNTNSYTPLVSKVACESEVLLGGELCCVLQAAENSVVFTWDLKEASEGADQRSGSRECHTEGTAVEKARDAKYEGTAGFENSKAYDDWSCLAGC